MTTENDDDGSDPDRPTADDRHVMRMEVEFSAAERLTFFSDAVVAIAITLLALELPVPGAGSNRQLLAEMNDHIGEYLAFLISFVVIGSHWASHHRVFRYLNRLGGAVLRLNMLWLLMMVSTPFVTRVITGDGGFLVRFSLYAAVQVVASVSFLLMCLEVRRHGLMRPGTPPRVLAAGVRRSGWMAVTFAVSIPLAVFGQWAFLVWVGLPIVVQLSHRAGARRASDPPSIIN